MNSDDRRDIAARHLHAHACCVGCTLDQPGGECAYDVGLTESDQRAADKLMAALEGSFIGEIGQAARPYAINDRGEVAS